jgi:endonuclease VIII
MPEGDTIFRTARALNRALTGQPIAYFDSNLAALAQANDQTPFTGQTITKVESRGKWLLIHIANPQSPEAPPKAVERKRLVTRARLQPGQRILANKGEASTPATDHPSERVLATHMLMSGSWHIYRAGEQWKLARRRMRMVLGAGDMVAVAFDVPIARFHTARTLERFAGVAGLGPDVLGSQFAADDVTVRLLEHGSEEIGNVLLNQRVLAGVGNVFKSEICFACGVNPFRKVESLHPREIECLLETARRYLAVNVVDGAGDGIVTYTGGRRTTGSSNPAARFWVYRRSGSECRRCGTTVLMRRQGLGARSTYWCPDCQKEKL